MKFKAFMLSGALVSAFLSSAVPAAVVVEGEPNDTQATALNLDGHFTLDHDADIGDMTANTSTLIPHVTVEASPGNNTFDWFSFAVASAGSKGIFDIDYAIQGDTGFDSWLDLFDAGGNLLASSDDASTLFGAGGSISGLDAYLEYTFASAGTYGVRVGNWCCPQPQAGGAGYELQVSIEDHALSSAVPEPATWAFMISGFGLIGGALRSSRRKNMARAFSA